MDGEFIGKVSSALRELDMLGNAKCVCAALSGGADSVSLLRALYELKEETGAEVCACHLNHGLRGAESDGDESFCRDLCGSMGVPLYAEKIAVSELTQKHESLEETARRARYAFFERALAHFEADLGECVLATAHNANDNAETVLLNLTRGTGLLGLCGIPPVRGLGERRVIRPLLRCTRGEIEEYLRSLGQGHVTDKTNLSEDYTRNKIRRRVLPELEGINPSVAETIGRMTRLLRTDSAFLEELAESALAETREGGGWNAARLAELPEPVRSRAVRLILAEGGIEPSALRIETAVSLLGERSARFNPCKNRFFTIRKGICFVEKTTQNYRRRPT